MAHSYSWQKMSVLPHVSFPVAQLVKNLPAMRETWVQSLDWEDPQKMKWQPIPVFLPGESQGRQSLVGCRLRGRKESDTAEATWRQQHTRVNQRNLNSTFV